MAALVVLLGRTHRKRTVKVQMQMQTFWVKPASHCYKEQKLAAKVV